MVHKHQLSLARPDSNFNFLLFARLDPLTTQALHRTQANAYSLENAVSMFMDSGAGGGTGGGGGGGGGTGEAAGGGAALSTPSFPSEAGG